MTDITLSSVLSQIPIGGGAMIASNAPTVSIGTLKYLRSGYVATLASVPSIDLSLTVPLAAWTYIGPVSVDDGYSQVRTDRRGRWMISSYNFVYISDDGLNTFSKVAIAGIHNCLATDRLGTWMMGNSDGTVSVSLDNGATWTSYATGTAGKVKGIDTDGAGVWIVTTDVTDSNVYRSINNGATWTVIGTGAGGAKGAIVTDRVGNWIFSLGSSIVKSIDNGLTWLNVGTSFGTLTTLGVSSDGTFMAASTLTIKSLSRSIDHGATWSTVSPSDGISRTSVGIATDDKGVWFSASINGLNSLRSTDNGVTWSPVQVPISTNAYGIDTDLVGNWVILTIMGEANLHSSGMFAGFETWQPGIYMRTA